LKKLRKRRPQKRSSPRVTGKRTLSNENQKTLSSPNLVPFRRLTKTERNRRSMFLSAKPGKMAGPSFKMSSWLPRKSRKKNPRKKKPSQSWARTARVAGCRGQKKKTQFTITEEAFPSMNPKAASASAAAANSVWAPAAKVVEKEKPTAQTAEKPTAQTAEKPTAQTKTIATSTPGEDAESAPAIAPVQTTEEKPPVPEADPKASAATAAPPKKNKFKKKKKKKKKKAADGPVATATEAATAAEPANTEEAAAKPAETEAAAAKPAEAASDTNSAPATSVPDTETNVVKKKKLNKFKKKKKKKKKKEGAV